MVRWWYSLQYSFEIEASGPRAPALSTPVRIRSPMYRITSQRVWRSASRSRMTGSSVLLRSRAMARRRSSSARKRTGLVAASSPRSRPRSVEATAQPASTSPTTWSAGVVAPEKKTSLNSLSPDMAVMGRTSTPGWRMSTSRNVMPRCLGAVGLVRARTKIRLASRAREVHSFWPSITQRPPSSTALVDSEARSEPDPGSEKPWHHRSSPLRMRGRKYRLCASVPHRRSVPPSILMPKVSL